jgi:hypothetical protein
MRFNLETSKLLYEVRYQDKKIEELYTYEQLYKDINGRYFMHFIGSKYSQYGVKTGYSDSAGREGDFYIDTHDINIWKYVSNIMKENHPEEYLIIDWEKEERESLIWMEQIALEKLPF